MDLIPLEAGGEGGLREVKVTPEAAALMDLRVTPVVLDSATASVDLFGKIAYDERLVTTTTARVGGRLDKFYVDYTGVELRAGDPIAEIYSPDLLVAQQDLIKATEGLKQAQASGTGNSVGTQMRLLQSVRQRLQLLQLTEAQIDAIASKETPSEQVTLYARQDGIVTKRHVVEGAYVKEGEALYAVAGLESVWLNLEAYEGDLAWLSAGQKVNFIIEAFPGETFQGKIAFIDPEVDPVRRVVKVRVDVSNEKRLLKPGMFARSMVGAPDSTDENKALLVPSSAVLRTGKRATVYVRIAANPEPKFEGREIILGERIGSQFVVESGLSEGELVVTNGAFKLDSELQIKARPSMMNRNSGLVERPAAEAEASLLGQWQPVPRALGRIENAVGRNDTTSALEAIADMKAAIAAVNATTFQPNTLQEWREFSMRLTNALTLAHKASPNDLRIAYSNVLHAVQEAGRYLGLPSAPTRMPKPVSDEMLEALRKTLNHYYPLAAALAADDLRKAIESRDQLVPHLQRVNVEARDLLAASDLTTLRVVFAPVSSALIDKVREMGADRVGNAYVVHCPMSFDDKGADWISPNPVVLNPYFGSEMLSCGSVEANLSFDAGVPTLTNPPTSHNHSPKDSK
ncbi:MAG: Cu(I)/Ag(I) efflux system membrane fusion protein [Verrucomicrobiales bacterium]|jgi:Cu(I)/Ag(I) efflux system membrane fusion protein